MADGARLHAHPAEGLRASNMGEVGAAIDANMGQVGAAIAGAVRPDTPATFIELLASIEAQLTDVAWPLLDTCLSLAPFVGADLLAEVLSASEALLKINPDEDGYFFNYEVFKSLRELAHVVHLSKPRLVQSKLQDVQKIYGSIDAQTGLLTEAPQSSSLTPRSAPPPAKLLGLKLTRARRHLYNQLKAIVEEIQMCNEFYHDQVRLVSSERARLSSERARLASISQQQCTCNNGANCGRLREIGAIEHRLLILLVPILQSVLSRTFALLVEKGLRARIKKVEASSLVVRHVVTIDNDETDLPLTGNDCFCGDPMYAPETLKSCANCGNQMHYDCARVFVLLSSKKKCPFCRHRLTVCNKSPATRYHPYA